MSDQTEHTYSVIFELKGVQWGPQYEVKDLAAANELLSAVARQAQVGKPIATFFYGVEQEKVAAIQVDLIISARTLIGNKE